VIGLTRPGSVPDLLVLGQENWDEMERRNQLLLRALADRNPDLRVLFVEIALRPRQLRRWRVPRPVQVTSNIWVVSVIRPLPDRFGKRLSDRAQAAQTRHAAQRVGLEQPWIWTQDPRSADLLDALDHVGLIFDMTDDWVAFEGDSTTRAEYAARTQRLLRNADLVFACSEALVDGGRELGTEPVLLPNAVAHPLGVPDPPAVLAGMRKPRVGYAGTLHSSRLDVDLLIAVAGLRPDWSFPLIGPNLLEPADAERLLAQPNIHHLGACAHSEVPHYLAGLELALIPHLVTTFTRSLNPLKAYEYLSAGLPVLATRAGVPQELSQEIEIVDGADDLVARAEELIAADSPERRAKRQALVACDTWEQRAADIEHHLGVRATAPQAGLVTVVVVSFNTRELLGRCLEALRNDGYPSLQTIVVDNASSDGSPEMVSERFPEVELLRLEENIGFGAANNVAFAHAKGEFVLLVNSDAFLAPGAVTEMLDVAARHEDVGVTGPRLLNPDGSLQRSAWPFPNAWRMLVEAVGLHRLLRQMGWFEDLGTWNHEQERSVDFLVGACLLIRRDALNQIGGFDETFWMYGEEADLQYRLHARGLRTMLAPRAVVTHIGSASAPGQTLRMQRFYSGQFRFLRKHGAAGSVATARLALLIGSLLRGRRASARAAVTGVSRP
jgi:N-acetylglucosaminyl-diphospho-decaprenol L-rhamnosyltransferase